MLSLHRGRASLSFARLACAGRAVHMQDSINTAPRTPERTAELECLADEHNGFLFGEIVR